jgi:UDP-N-acetylglucosamine transferase subunit ALG13
VIFVTVGGELPFDRLIRAMDAFAAAHPDQAFLAQIGAAGFEPAHMPWVRTLGRADYAAALAAAEVVVAHAGIGSLLSAGERGKPIVLLPRRARLGEHRNDHQHDTAGHFAGRPGIFVAADETELAGRIAAARHAAARGGLGIDGSAPAAFLDRLRAFVLDGG